MTSKTNNNSNIRICYWNSDGIKNKIPELQQFVNDKQIDIVLLQETKLSPTEKLRIMNFDTYRKDRTAYKEGGVALMINRKIPHSLVEFNGIQEGIELITIQIPTGRHKLFISSCYVPPKIVIDPNLFPNLFHANHPTILAGDLNSKHPCWNSKTQNKNGEILIETTLKHDIVADGPKDPTHEHYATGRTDVLDMVLLKNYQHYYTLEVCPEMVSDHRPVILQLTRIPYHPHIHRNPKTNWNNFTEQLQQDISPQTHLYTSPEAIENAIARLTSKIVKAIEENSHETKETKNPFLLPHPIRVLIRNRNRARKCWVRTGLQIDRQKYTKLIKEVRKKIQEHRQDAWNNYISSVSTQDGTLWQLTKKLTNSNSKIPYLVQNGTKIFEDKVKAEIMADNYFKQFQASTDCLNDWHTKIHNEVGKNLETIKQNFFAKKKKGSTPKHTTPELLLIIKN